MQIMKSQLLEIRKKLVEDKYSYNLKNDQPYANQMLAEIDMVITAIENISSKTTKYIKNNS